MTVAEVKGRAVTFEVGGAATASSRSAAAAISRFVVDVKTTEQRLAAKAAKAGLT